MSRKPVNIVIIFYQYCTCQVNNLKKVQFFSFIELMQEYACAYTHAHSLSLTFTLVCVVYVWVDIHVVLCVFGNSQEL